MSAEFNALFAGDQVLPGQMGSRNLVTGERRLASAVLNQALEDLSRLTTRDKADEMVAFFFGPSVGPYSFELLCTSLELDMGRLREAAAIRALIPRRRSNDPSWIILQGKARADATKVCPQGHEIIEGNIRYQRHRARLYRACLACHRKQVREYMQRRRMVEAI